MGNACWYSYHIALGAHLFYFLLCLWSKLPTAANGRVDDGWSCACWVNYPDREKYVEWNSSLKVPFT